MRTLILSESITRDLRSRDPAYHPPNNIQLDYGEINYTEDFNFSLFDYDISIVHIEECSYHTHGYFNHLPKLQRDTEKALEHGRTVICLPESCNFVSQMLQREGMSAYEWLLPFGVELQDNEGVHIKSSGLGRAQVIQQYLDNSPKYYQIVTTPPPDARNKLAVVNDTDILVGLEHQVGNGVLVILPPPSFSDDTSDQMMARLLAVAGRYYERSLRRVSLEDAPDWVDDYLVLRAKELADQTKKIADEKERYDRIAYVLYGTNTELEDSVAALLTELGLEVQPQPPGANIDLKAKHPNMDVRFAIEVTGTKDVIHKDSNKSVQAWQYITDRQGTPEEKDRLIIVANTQCHLDPRQRRRDAYTLDTVKLLGRNEVLLITTPQLYELWKAVHEGRRAPDDVIRELYDNFGLFKQ